MATYGVVVGRVLLGIAGTLLIYCSLFLYKEEEGGLENALEQWWQSIRSVHAHAISRETAFLKTVAEITAKGFAKLFGERLFGPKAMAASICYSLASLLFSLDLVDLGTGLESKKDIITVSIAGFFCLLFLLLGSLGPYIINKPISKRVWLACVLLAVGVWLALTQKPGFGFRGQETRLTIALACMLPLATGCDFLFIALTRYMLTCASESNSSVKITGLALSNVAFAAVLLVLPYAIGLGLYFYHIIPEYVLAIFLATSLSNVFDTLVSLAWVFVASGMLLHRIIWPLIERPIYALHRHHVLTDQKKLLFFGGVALVGLAIPSVGKTLESVVKAVHG